MEEEQKDQKGFVAWAKAHRKQLTLAGISVVSVIGIALGLKNKDTLIELWGALEKGVKNVSGKSPDVVSSIKSSSPSLDEVKPTRPYTSPTTSFDVSQHVRTLSGGRQHSAEKAAEAAAMGITLQPNQTLVNSYTKFAA